MTKEEAVNTLANLKRYVSGGGVVDRKANEAIDMAISALNVPDTNVGDTISRQAAIDAMAELQGRAFAKGVLIGIHRAWEAIKALPSAQPRKKGKWIEYNATGKNQWMCSECCAEEKNPKVARFCYWCGAEMERRE